MNKTFTKRNPTHPATPGPWYLATPYSKYAEGIEAAFALACWQTGLLIRAGVPVFSPIAHSHPVAKACGIPPLDHSIWLPVCKPLIDVCRGIIMLTAEGWEQSYGMEYEFKQFDSTGRPVVYMAPGVVPPEVRP